MMNRIPSQKNRSAHFRSWYLRRARARAVARRSGRLRGGKKSHMPATARDMDPSGPRIARPGPKIMHQLEIAIVRMLKPIETDAYARRARPGDRARGPALRTRL